MSEINQNEIKSKLIDLSGLSLFLSNLWTKIKSYVDPKFKKYDAATWVGKSEDVDDAVASGAIIPGYTLVTITDDDEKEIIYNWATTEDIRRLFGLT